MNYLQITLLSNALFSLLSGVSLLIFRNSIATLFGQQNSTVFWILGIGLIFFSYSVFVQVKNPKPDAVFYIIMQDLIWVVASIILLITNPFNITPPGNQIIAGVAFIVLIFGTGQSIGIAQFDTIKDKGVKQLLFERVVSAAKEDAWNIVSDVANYHNFAPNIDNTTVISGQGEGMVRQCSNGDGRWMEECTLWAEGEKYSFVINTDAEDYPYPLKYLKGTWEVEETSEIHTRIRMIFEFKYKRKIYNLLLHPFMQKNFKKICKELLDNWEKKLKDA